MKWSPKLPMATATPTSATTRPERRKAGENQNSCTGMRAKTTMIQNAQAWEPESRRTSTARS